MSSLEIIISWMNKNSGFLSFAIFIVSIFLAWITGIFKSILKKPKLKVDILNKLTFYSRIETNNINNFHKKNVETAKNVFVLYLDIANIGYQKTSIKEIELGYSINYFRKNWLKMHHLPGRTTMNINAKQYIEIFPLLSFTETELNSDKDKSKLDIAEYLTGYAYFETREMWGDSIISKRVTPKEMTLRIKDVYGKKYYFKINVSYMDINELKTFNKNIGTMVND